MKNKLLIASLTSLSLEIIMFFLMVFLFALDSATGRWQSFGAIAVAFLISFISLLCIIFSISLIREKGRMFPAIIFILISMLMIIPLNSASISKALSNYLIPLAEHYDDGEFKLNKNIIEKRYAHDYKKLLKEFNLPYKAIDVKKNYVLLDKKRVVKLYGKLYALTQDKMIECENDLREILINQNNLMQIRLPVFSEFVEEYNWGRSWQFDKEQNGNIPVLIYVNGELLNLRYVQGDYKKILQKYQKIK